jgi:hypothetical protein
VVSYREQKGGMGRGWRRTHHHGHALELDAVTLGVEILERADYRGEGAACTTVSVKLKERIRGTYPPTVGRLYQRCPIQSLWDADTGSCRSGGSGCRQRLFTKQDEPYSP